MDRWDCLFADISHWERDFDAKKYDKKILVNKCTDGRTYVDKTHAPRKKECADAGILYGGYHFFQCDSDIEEQVNHYLKTHGEFLLPPIVDFEKDKNQDEHDLKDHIPQLLEMLTLLEKKTGKIPIIYSYFSLIRFLKLPKEFARYPLWIARYSERLGVVPAPWNEKTVLAWQYGDGKVGSSKFPMSYSGIGRCDGNIYFKENDLLRLFK
jgi:lysozyme